jgi:flagellar basal-body rod modification protein FlgD
MIALPDAEGSGMSIAALSSSATGTQLPSTGQNSKMQLSATDFIKMMVTQLQNQDPTQPASSDQLLAQMSQIGQLQASTALQTSLSGLVMQNQIGAAGNLIGKSVQGMDAQNNTVSGVVNSVRVQQNQVFLELDNSHELPLGNVTTIAPAPVAGAVAGSAASSLLNQAKSA